MRLLAMVAALIVTSALPAVAQQNDRVRYGIASEPASLNPIFLNGSEYARYGELLFEPLVRFGPAGSQVPGLAERVPTLRDGGISADGKTVTFTIRRGVRWQDGTPVTALDVKCGFDQIMNPKNAIGIASQLEDVDGVQTPAAYTVVFHLKTPSPAIAIGLDQLVALPAHLLAAKSDIRRDPYNAQPVGDGPYRLSEWHHGDRITLTASDTYFRGKPRIGTIELRVVPSARTQVLQMQTHELDMIGLQPLLADLVPRDGVRFATTASLSWSMLGFNTKRPALADVRVRRAIAQAIDRRAIAKIDGRGFYASDDAMLPMFQWAYDPSYGPPPYDPAAASRLLDLAGWRLGPDGTRRKGSEELRLSLVFAAGGTGVAPAAIADGLERVHVHVDQKQVPPSLLFAPPADGGPLRSGNFDLSFGRFSNIPDPGISWLFDCDQAAPAGFNFMRYCNPQTDAAFTSGDATPDPALRRRAYARVQALLERDLPVVVLWRVNDSYAYPAWLRGVAPSPYSPFWNVYAWSAS